MKNFKKILRTGIIGTIIGSIAGVLFAKKSGEETRKEWGKKIDNMKDKAVDFSKKTAEELKETKEELKEDAEEIKKSFKSDKK